MWRQASECSDESELRIDHVNGEAELRLLRKAKATLGFTLHHGERISRRDKQGSQDETAVRRICEVADFVCNLKGLTNHITANQWMFHPWHDGACEALIGRRLEAFQATLFNQFIAELSESERALVLAEPIAPL